MGTKICSCHKSLFIFTYEDEEGNEHCIDCDRIVKHAPMVKPAA